MTTATARKKLVDYLQTADEKRIKALYMMFEDEIETGGNAWGEPEFTELENRSNSFADGTAKTYTWEETKQAAIERAKNKMK